MKKALKIVKRLEETTSNNKSNIEIAKRGEKIIYANKENHLLIRLIHIVLIITPLILIYFQKNELNLFVIIIFILCSIISLLSYLKGSFQTNNKIEIDLAKGEMIINRNGFFGKSILKDMVVKTQKSNEILEEDIPFSDSLDKRITLKNNEAIIPLFDLKYDSDFDQIFLSLELLAKGN